MMTRFCYLYLIDVNYKNNISISFLQNLHSKYIDNELYNNYTII